MTKSRLAIVLLLIIMSVVYLVNTSPSGRSKTPCWMNAHACWGGHGKRSGPADTLNEMEKPEFVLQESPEKYSRTKQQQFDVFNNGDRADRFLPLPLPMLMRSSFGNPKILGIPNSILIPLESHQSALNEYTRNDDDTIKDTSEYLSSFMANMPEMVSSKHL